MGATLDVAPLDDTGTAVAAAEVPLFGRFKGVTFGTDCSLPFILCTSAGSAGSGFLVTLSF